MTEQKQRQKILGINSHPLRMSFITDYEMFMPEGITLVRLDEYAWGHSSNMMLFFTDIISGTKHKLGVFSRDGYQPRINGPAFDKKELGSYYRTTIRKGKRGGFVFAEAIPLEGLNVKFWKNFLTMKSKED